MLLVEGVWSLGGEAGFVLATQDPVGQRELDLGVLQESERRSWSVSQHWCNQTSFTISNTRLSPVSEPPGLKMEAGNLEEESGFLSGGFLNRSWLTGRQSRERAAHNNRVRTHSEDRGLTWNCLMAGLRHLLAAMTCTFMIWMEWARARWRAPISRSDRGKTC